MGRLVDIDLSLDYAGDRYTGHMWFVFLQFLHAATNWEGSTFSNSQYFFLALAGDPSGPEAATVATDTDEYTAANVRYTQLSYVSTVLYFTIASTMKLSILLMYNRLFSVSRSFRRQIAILFGIVIGFWIGCTVANLLDCVPIEYTWINSLADPRYCFNYNIFWFASGICEAFIDVMIIMLPVRVVLGLQLNRKQKIAVSSVFLLGAL